jgi:hypothetical protein
MNYPKKSFASFGAFIILVGILSIGGYFLFKSKRKKKNKDEDEDEEINENTKKIIKMRKADIGQPSVACVEDIIGRAQWYKDYRDAEGKQTHPPPLNWTAALHDSIVHYKKCNPNPIDPLDTLYASFETPAYRPIWDKNVGKDVKISKWSPD